MLRGSEGIASLGRTAAIGGGGPVAEFAAIATERHRAASRKSKGWDENKERCAEFYHGADIA
jgi:hypothetical protein